MQDNCPFHSSCEKGFSEQLQVNGTEATTLLFLVGQRFLLNFLAALARGSHRKIFLASTCEVLIRIHFNKHSGVMNGFLFHPHIHIFFSPLFLCVWVKTVLSVPNGWTCSFFSYTYSNYNRKERSKWQEKKKKRDYLGLFSTQISVICEILLWTNIYLEHCFSNLFPW